MSRLAGGVTVVHSVQTLHTEVIIYLQEFGLDCRLTRVAVDRNDFYRAIADFLLVGQVTTVRLTTLARGSVDQFRMGPEAFAWPAINTSYGPIGVPFDARWARISPACRASS